MATTVKHFAGFISPEVFKECETAGITLADVWRPIAQAAAEDGQLIVCFRVPMRNDLAVVQFIEGVLGNNGLYLTEKEADLVAFALFGLCMRTGPGFFPIIEVIAYKLGIAVPLMKYAGDWIEQSKTAPGAPAAGSDSVTTKPPTP